MLCLNYTTKIEFFCWIRSRIEKNKWVQKKKLPHSSGDSFFIWTLSLTLLSLYELLHVCYRFRELCAGGTFRFFSGSFFYTYTNLFPSYCFSDDGTAEQPQECLTTFPVIISFAFLLRLIIYFISVEVQPSAIPDSRLLISLSISFSLPDKLIS